MAEYTFKEVIIDPTTEKVKSYIGKNVYASDCPNCCLEYANENNKLALQKLIGIFPGTDKPFKVSNGCSYYVTCIIPKKENLKPEYVPFDLPDEFINAYDYCINYRITNGTIESKILKYDGIWLKSKYDDIRITQCIEISDKGIVIGLNHQITLWKDLLDNYEFIDGTPCGKIKE